MTDTVLWRLFASSFPSVILLYSPSLCASVLSFSFCCVCVAGRSLRFPFHLHNHFMTCASSANQPQQLNLPDSTTSLSLPRRNNSVLICDLPVFQEKPFLPLTCPRPALSCLHTCTIGLLPRPALHHSGNPITVSPPAPRLPFVNSINCLNLIQPLVHVCTLGALLWVRYHSPKQLYK